MFQNPLLSFKKFLVFSNILMPSYFLHKNIVEVELKDILQAKTQPRPWSSVTLVTTDNIAQPEAAWSRSQQRSAPF